MKSYFEQLEQEIEVLESLSKNTGPNAFFAQEALRFRSMGGTLLNVPEFKLNEAATADERHITHTLTRSFLENYFWVLYIFDKPDEKQARYDEMLNSFRRDYAKMYSEPQLPSKNQLQVPDSGWSQHKRALDVKSMLAQIRNGSGERLDFLYFTYRIASFDTHGRNLGTIGRSVFGTGAYFPVLKIREVIELVANQYLVVLQALRAAGELQS